MVILPLVKYIWSVSHNESKAKGAAPMTRRSSVLRSNSLLDLGAACGMSDNCQ